MCVFLQRRNSRGASSKEDGASSEEDAEEGDALSLSPSMSSSDPNTNPPVKRKVSDTNFQGMN